MFRPSFAVAGLALLLACSGDPTVTGPDDLPTLAGDSVMILAAGADLPSPGCVAPPTDLVAWWRAESADSTDDWTGDHHGTPHGALALQPAKVGEGFVFDGSSAVVIPHDPALDLSSELTIEMWYSRADVGGWWGLLGKRHDGSNRANFGINASRDFRGLGLYFNDPDPLVRGGDDPPSAGFETVRLGWLPAADEFHHFAGTYRQLDSSSVELRMFVDGRVVREDTLPGSLGNSLTDTDLVIGASYAEPGLGETFQGVIDEVTIYRRALAATEIAAIVEADAAGKCTEPVPPPPVTIPLQLGDGHITINCRNPHRVIAVQLISSDTFDATTVDHGTVRLAGGAETHRKAGTARRHEDDVNDDGRTDLVVHVRLGDTDIQCGDTDVDLTASTFGGTEVSATATIRTVGDK